MDEFALRILENGLYNKHLQWATALVNALFRPPSLITAGTKLIFTMNMISGVFSIFIGGVTASCIIFLIEIIYVRCLRKFNLFKLDIVHQRRWFLRDGGGNHKSATVTVQGMGKTQAWGIDTLKNKKKSGTSFMNDDLK